MRVLGRLDAKRAEQRDVLGGVAQVILPANDVRDAHLQVIHHVDQVEHRLPVRAHDDEVRVSLLAVGQLAPHVADHQIGNQDRLAAHLELDRAFLLVGQSLGEQALDPPPVILLALALEIRPAVALCSGRWHRR